MYIDMQYGVSLESSQYERLNSLESVVTEDFCFLKLKGFH